MRRYLVLFVVMMYAVLLPIRVVVAQTITPLSEKLYYQASFSGINFGKVGIEIDAQADKASVTCDIASSGIMALFVKHSSHTTLTASGGNFVYTDKVYESRYHTRKKKRHVKLTYKAGKIAEEIIEPPDDRTKRPAVPDADKNAAYDLMSFLLQIRNEIIKAKNDKKTTFTINGYDGRRLTQADFTIVGEKTIKIMGQKQSALVVTSRRKLLAGYTKSELEDYSPDEPSMTSYFSNDEKLIPLRMEIPFFMQTIRADLVKKCDKSGECLLGIGD